MDLLGIFAALEAYGVAYVLVGALGAVAHGARIRTRDVDLCPVLDAENLTRLATLLHASEARLLRVPPRGLSAIDLANAPTLQLDDPTEHHLFATRMGDIDILPAPLGPGGWGTSVTYRDLRPQAVLVRAFGLVVPVAALSAIVSSKQAAGRPQDQAAAAELARVATLLAQGVAPEYGLEQFVQEHGGPAASGTAGAGDVA